ncbi:CBS domain-containing protein [Allofranklinella schreckenbergeri]|uniref:CBS domain-containing protein n=2 Tax=Allofranklinella schreckenbergeri TaxID=1076744 RepID=A0A3M6QE98_9BURK|nr:CBS domain-containing protein [Allofranklinella schreckenbergeri]
MAMSFLSSSLDRLRQFLLDLRPAPTGIALQECVRIMGGCALSIAVVALAAQWLAQSRLEVFWHGAVLASSALLVFALPFSPMAQPWAVLTGSLVCTAVGMVCSWLIGPTVLAASLAVPLAIVAMIYLRAVHPPATSLALYAVLQHIHSPGVLVFPIGFNALLLIVIAMLYNHATGRRYPHRQVSVSQVEQDEGKRLLTQTDVDQVLARHNELLAISRNDLTQMLQQASGAAYERAFGEMRCADIMTTQVHCVQADMALEAFQDYMRQHQHRELPVIDAQGHLLGMVGLAQWMQLQFPAEASAGGAAGAANASANIAAHAAGSRWRQWMRQSWKALGGSSAPPTIEPPAPQRVRDIMVPSVAVAHGDQPVMELLGLLCQGGVYHLPVVGEHQRLMGIITQTDVLRALNQALPETAPRTEAPAPASQATEPEAGADAVPGQGEQADASAAPVMPNAPAEMPAQALAPAPAAAEGEASAPAGSTDAPGVTSAPAASPPADAPTLDQVPTNAAPRAEDAR